MSGPAPTVSVVIPTYNAPALLLETLATVFAQTFDDFEVIVVVDGCTDDTEARLRAVGDPRLRVIVQPNAGIGAARNRGIDEARGAYVALLDHDDLWHPEKLARQVTFMRAHPACVASIVPWAFSDSPGRVAIEWPRFVGRDGVIGRPLRAFVETGMLFTSAALMVDRARCAGLRYGEARPGIEDFEFQVGLLARGPLGLVPSDVPLMTYRVHPNNASGKSDFFDAGLRTIRRQVRAGRYDSAAPGWRDDLRDYVAVTSHYGVARMLADGRPGAALRNWAQDWPKYVRAGRWRFAVALPLAALLPAAWVRRRWRFRVGAAPAASTEPAGPTT